MTHMNVQAMNVKNKRGFALPIPVLILTVLFFLGGFWGANGCFAEDAGEFKLPAYEKFVLENGLTVYLMEQHEVPMIDVSIVVPAGAVKDGKAFGLASLTADALVFGTKSYTKSQIEEKLDFLGADYNTFATAETTGITSSFAKKDLNTVMPIIKEILVDPVFDQEELAKRKKRLLLQLEMAKERPNAVVFNYFSRFLFGGHGYGNPIGGTPQTVAGITVDHIKTFYKTNYIPAGSAIAVVGDFKTADMKKDVEKWFSGWKAEKGADVAEAVKPPVFSFDGNRVLLVNKDDATETRFLIGAPGIKRSNPDFIPISVINTILGGRFTSWLNDELRVNAGLTYGAFSLFRHYKYSGMFVVSSFTRTSKTVEALDLAVEVLERLHKKGVDEKTLSSAKNYIKGQYPPRFETSGQLAGLLTEMFTYGFNESFINDFQANVDKMTVEKAKEIVAKYFPKDKLQFVLIGKASEIRDKVKKYGKVTEKEIKAEGF